MTTFYFVRHGEPDYDSVGEWNRIPFGKEFAGLTNNGIEQIKKAAHELSALKPQIILTSPYTRTMQGASIISKILNIEIIVEKNLHEWNSDLSHSICDGGRLYQLCKEHDEMKGIYPDGITMQWESTELLKKRVYEVLTRYEKYDRVVVSGHAMMMQAVTGESRAYEYGEIKELELCL